MQVLDDYSKTVLDGDFDIDLLSDDGNWITPSQLVSNIPP